MHPAPEGGAYIAPGASGLLYLDYNKYNEVFSKGVADEDALVMAVSQKPISGAAFGTTSGVASWKTKPSWYQISNNDKMIQPKTETWFAERIKARKTITLDAGHASMASHSEEISALIIEAAEALAG
ncbi:hypothetical protein GCM10023149_24370 [Mucilaginibacter gynuensis]|uniref:AB hydrolase-1 domain-containing protein n=1 Tax=Mucilaginibacter gynuensis TaxID=1302236 RepID=A0ABP8GFH9_9SPHI